jgi:DNA-binding CsgD family transcriptional regulator
MRSLSVSPDGIAISSLIERIYEAALDESLWPDVLRRLNAVTESQAATFWVLDSQNELKLPTFGSVDFDPDFVQEYLDLMAPHDPVNHYLAQHPDQRIVQDASILTESEKDRDLFYDWQARNAETRHRVVGTISPMPFVQSGVALHRVRNKGEFEPSQIAQFRLLFRHVGRALEVGFRLGSFGNLQQVTLDLLDRNPLAIMLLDDKGRVILTNRAAGGLHADLDGVLISAKGLALARASDDRRLKRFIADALSPSRDARIRPGGAMLAPRPSGKRSLSILVSPLAAGPSALAALRPAACVIIADPDHSEEPPTQRLRALFGLTPAEARLVIRLAMGDELKSAASKLGIGYPSARALLAAIFHKTATTRQGELIRLLLTAVPVIGI